MYVISDGNTYLAKDSTGGYKAVKHIVAAETWGTEHKAKNILRNCVNKNLRNRYRVVYIKDGDNLVSKETSTTSTENTAKNANPNTPFKGATDASKEYSAYDIVQGDSDKWKSEIVSISDTLASANDRMTALNKQLSDVDLEISDVNHYIELSNLNAYQGYLAYKMLKTRLKQRREIKNEMYILSKMGEMIVSNDRMAEIVTALNNASAREYAPRRLTKLFENVNTKM